MTDTLIVFLRRPIKGKVKSRLAKSLGEDKALDIYRWLLEITHNSILNLDVEGQLYFDSNENEKPNWSDQYSSKLQNGPDLGEKMFNAFSDVLDGSSKVVMIGSDCPEMNENLLKLAFDALDDKEVVLGPARDGGVYLIGMKGNSQSLLSNIPWETERVFETLLENVGREDAAILPIKRDIDHEEDFREFEKEFEEFRKKLNYA